MEQVNHTVVRGDTLSTIARTYNTTVESLAALNDLSIKSNLYIGQVLVIRNKTITPSMMSSRASSPYIVDVTGMGLQSNSDNTIFITWSFKTPNTDHYVIEWGYSTADGRWYSGSNDTCQNDIYGNIPKESTYSPPDNAISVRSRIQPVSKTYKDKNNNDVSYWNGQWTSWQTYAVKNNPPLKPPVPMVKIDGYEMTVYNTNLDINATHMEYEIAWGDAWHYKTGVAEIKTTHAYYKTTISPSWNYKARGRGKRGNVYGPWSEYSDNIQAVPTAPYGIDTLEAISDTAVKLTWTKIGSAKTYSIQYAEKEIYFEGSNGTTTIDGIETTSYIVTGLNKGTKYHFRLKCVNDAGSSGWCESRSIIIGEKPEPPSTWSDKTVVTVGEKVLLSWLHNTVDGSEQKESVIEFNVNGITDTHTIGMDINEKPINTFELPTFMFEDGTKVYWRVKTKGILNEYSDWSIQRVIDVYAPPTLSINILNENNHEINTIRSFPFTIKTNPEPPSQKPIVYSVSIKAKDSYISNTPFGDKQINVDEEIYSKIINYNKQLDLVLSANDIDLHNGINYELVVRVTMDSGLSADASKLFDVEWDELICVPNAELLFDKEQLLINLRPYCELPMDLYKVVRNQNGRYTETNDELEGGFVTATSIDKAITNTKLQVYSDDKYRLFCIREGEKIVPYTDVTLSVYRRAYDGEFVEISKNINGNNNTFITDPHPSLDYARYRIVASDNKTGAISYTDISPKSFDNESIVVQWDESWSDFIVDDINFEDKTKSSSSMLVLPYNINISESNSPDVSAVSYIGRKHPVSYYGTALGVTANVTTDIKATDVETLYALRRLSTYMGDAYIRLPSGVGYWANVKVNYDKNYDSLVIPVTLSITRVNGGL